MTDPADSSRPTPHVAYVPSRPAAMPDDAAAAACDPANIVGKYVRVVRIGAGGMGEVWRAWDRDLRRWTALKFLKTTEGEERERFLREAQTAARLTHPNICPIYEVGRHGERDYIAMQLVQGKTLAGQARDDRRRVVSLVRDAASALHHAHERGIVHRDVKPQNIMVEGERVFVMDFGLAKETSVQSSLSLSGYLSGTPTYMSPEQGRGKPALIGPHSDVYSLGVTLYEMIVGRPPFVEKDIYELVRLHTEVDPPKPRGIDPTIDRDLETVALKALEKDPARRYASARDLADDLGRWLAGEHVYARPPSVVHRLARFASRRKGVLIASFVAVATAVAFAAWATSTVLERRRADHARAERDRATVEAMNLIERARHYVDEVDALMYTAEGPSDGLLQRVVEMRALLEQAIARAPWLAQGHYVLGRAWHIEGREDRAMACWMRTLEIDPRFAPALLERTRVRMNHAIGASVDSGEKDWDTARRLAEDALEAIDAAAFIDAGFENPVERAVASFLLALARRETEEAKRIATDALARWGTRRGAEELHVLMTLLLAETDELMASVDRALKIRPWYPQALLVRALIFYWTGRTREAVSDLDRALRVGKRETDNWLLRARIRAELGDRGAVEDCDRAIELGAVARGWYVRGIVRRTLGDPEGAIEDCSTAIRLGFEDWGAWNTRGCARMDLGRWEEGLADFDEVIRRAPKASDGYGNRAVMLVKLGRADAALAAADEAVRLAPGRSDVRTIRGMVCVERGDLAGALAEYDETIRLQPTVAAHRVNRSTVRVAAGDSEGAIADLEAAVRLRPDFAIAHFALARLYGRARRTDDALRSLDEALRCDPSNVDAWLLRARAHHERDDYAAAIRDYTEALRRSPGRADVHQNRGAARDMLEDLDGAVADYDEAIRLEPKRADPYANRGFIRQRRGDAAGARADLKKALELAPADWPGRANVESALKQLGE